MNYKSKYLDLCKPRVVKVTVDGYQEPFYVKSLTVADRVKIELSQHDENSIESQLSGIVLGWCDPQGNPVFSYPDDCDAVANFDSKLLKAISNAVAEASGLKATAIEEAEKN